jgi:hypothetical protein
LIGIHLPEDRVSKEKIYIVSANEKRNRSSGMPMTFDLGKDEVLIDLYNEVSEFWQGKKIDPPKLVSKFLDGKQNSNGKN